MKTTLAIIATSLIFIQSSYSSEDELESTKCCDHSSKVTAETPTGMYVCDSCTISQEVLLDHFSQQKKKTDEISRLHNLLSDQAKELQEKDEKIKLLEHITPSSNSDSSPVVTTGDCPHPISVPKPLEEQESGGSFDWPQYRAKEQDKLLEEKYKKSLVESAESYRQASALLGANEELEEELEKEKEKFLKAKQAQDRVLAERQRQEELRRAEAKRNDTTGKHIEQVGQQVTKEAARVVHQAGNIGKRIIKKF